MHFHAPGGYQPYPLPWLVLDDSCIGIIRFHAHVFFFIFDLCGTSAVRSKQPVQHLLELLVLCLFELHIF